MGSYGQANDGHGDKLLKLHMLTLKYIIPCLSKDFENSRAKPCKTMPCEGSPLGRANFFVLVKRSVFFVLWDGAGLVLGVSGFLDSFPVFFERAWGLGLRVWCLLLGLGFRV